MSFFNQLSLLIEDPPPGHVFELSEAGIAFARPAGGRPAAETGFVPFERGTLEVSPVADNILKTEAASAALRGIAPADGSSKKRRRAALILPDYAARVSVLDFDSFPASPDEQASLVRFRLKKTLPFEIESAAVSHFVQPAAKGKKVEVVAVAAALEIVARYEALLRSMNFHPGEVTTSALASLNLYQAESEGAAVIAKLTGKVLTVMVISGAALKLFRCVALDEPGEGEILSVLHPTMAYVEDELGVQAPRLVVCGFPPGALSGWNGRTEALRSRHGAPGAYNAGLLGYLEGVRN
jgi:type IV pilus assembly protein PilM